MPNIALLNPTSKGLESLFVKLRSSVITVDVFHVILQVTVGAKLFITHITRRWRFGYESYSKCYAVRKS